MILTILAACTAPIVFDVSNPLFKFTDLTCTPERQQIDCACSEGMTWNATPRTQWFEIRRIHTATGQVNQVGVTTATRWWFRSDFPFPRAKESYEYSVRGCRRDNGLVKCSKEWSERVKYTAARYACFRAGVEVECYPGDPVGQ